MKKKKIFLSFRQFISISFQNMTQLHSFYFHQKFHEVLSVSIKIKAKKKITTDILERKKIQKPKNPPKNQYSSNSFYGNLILTQIILYWGLDLKTNLAFKS